MNRVSEEQLKEAINGFQFEGNLISIKPYGSGHINDTYLLTYEIGKMGSIRVILQRVNQEIFTNPVELMRNIEGVTTYLKKIIKKNGGIYIDESIMDYYLFYIIINCSDDVFSYIRRKYK